jgi:hypothetical protein
MVSVGDVIPKAVRILGRRTSMDLPYKSHLITATAVIDLETNRWTPRLLIVSEGGGIARLERRLFKTSYPTEAEAERAAVAFAERCIDENNPDLPET